MSTAVPIVHIVDDDASFLAATSRLLRASGFAVKTLRRRQNFSRSAMWKLRAARWWICKCRD